MPKRPREEPCHICGHWHDYENGEPCTVCGHTLARTQPAPALNSCFPSDILPGFLYLGSYDDASRSELLKAQGITHILNTVPTCQNLYKNSFKYHTVQTSPPEYPECFAFLESVKQEGGRVLVHCMTGVSRSPSVVIAYLMQLRQWRLNDSYKWVHDRRPIISVQEGEAARLQQLEMQLHGSSSTDYASTSAPASGHHFSLANQLDASQQSPSAFAGSPNGFSFGQQSVTPPGGYVFGKT